MKTGDKNRFFDDAAALLSGGLEFASGVSRESSALLRERLEKLVRDLDLVDAETHAITQAMAAKAREENQVLEEKIKILEARIAKLETQLK